MAMVTEIALRAAETVRVAVRRLAHAADLPLPLPASAGSSGYDLRAAVAEDLVLAPGGRCLVPTGLVLEIPGGWEGQVRPRSGLALRSGITVPNAPGTIDSDYREFCARGRGVWVYWAGVKGPPVAR
jgi:dUTP pyrophosphatase